MCSRFNFESPASYVSVLDMAGDRAYLRRVLLSQRQASDTIACYRGDKLLAIAMFKQWRARRVEFALMIKPEAGRYMYSLLRIAHLTLLKIRQSSMLIYARINPLNLKGQRMARILGFQPGRFHDDYIWIFKG